MVSCDGWGLGADWSEDPAQRALPVYDQRMRGGDGRSAGTYQT